MFKLAILADISSPHTIRWVNSLASFDIDILLIGLGDKHNYVDIPNVKVISYKNKKVTDSYLGKIFFKLKYLIYVLKIIKEIKRFNPDILHSYYASSYGLIGALTRIKPYVISVWGSDVTDFPNKSNLHRKLIKYNLKATTSICATSFSLKDETSKYSSKNVNVIPFGIDIDRFSPRNKKLSKQITIGTVKYFDKIYGIDTLIKAFSILIKDKKLDFDLKLLLVGDGKEKQNYIDLIKSEGISDRVEFTGFVKNNLLVEKYHNMDIVVIPSLRESFGLSVIEAMSCEIPVIASDISGFREVGTDETITYFNAGDSQMLSTKIYDIINNYDVALAKAKIARKRVIDNFSSANCVNMQINLYKELNRSYNK